jgi:hypothetical protein
VAKVPGRDTRALAAIADLKRVYGLDYDVHGFRGFVDDATP